jgi:hypothetical protein
MERWVEQELEQRGGEAGAVGYIAAGLFGRVWDLAIQRALNPLPAEAARALATEARALLCAAAGEAGAPADLRLSLDPHPLWVAPDTARRVADALSRASRQRKERLKQVAHQAALMACALEAEADGREALCPVSLLELMPRLGVEQVMRMLQDESGEEQQRRALRLLSEGMGVHVDVDL